MKRATTRNLAVASLGVLVLGIVLAVITAQNNDYLARALYDSLGLSRLIGPAQQYGNFWFFAFWGPADVPGDIFALAAVISVIVFVTGYVGALVKLARLNQWLWIVLFVVTAIIWPFAPISMLVYLFAGPTTPARIPFGLAGSYARAEQIPPDALKGGIFLSYRREDSADICGRIYDHLTTRYSTPKVFKDVDNIPYGADFPTYIQARLRECAVCLVIIGPRWLTSAGAEGQRRLDDPGDFVRLEIEGALGQGLAVIPVLVYGAGLPPAEALPASLGRLRTLNAAPVRLDPDFAADVRRLCESIDQLVLRPTVA